MAHDNDSIEKIGGSIIQHGPHSNRVYLMGLRGDETQRLLTELDALAQNNGYTKIFAKIPAARWASFQRRGYLLEAKVPRLFRGADDGLFVSKYLSDDRRQGHADARLGELLHGDTLVETDAGEAQIYPGPTTVRRCRPEEAPEMSSLYRRVFASYPFPITAPAYIARTMEGNIRYYCIREGGAMVALASAEMDLQGENAELTDFATLPEWRGRGFAAALLRHMEGELAATGIRTTYTIARAESYAMNLVFKRCGYSYGGFLANNTNIAGSIQSMTVWYRHLRKGASSTASQAEYA